MLPISVMDSAITDALMTALVKATNYLTSEELHSI
jgi:hypothetical protein